MVPNSDEDSRGNPQVHLSAPGNDLLALTPESTASTPSQANPDGFEGVRKSLRKQQISERATNIILQSWRSGTKKQYNIYINKWSKFCREKQINNVQTSIGYALDFLTELFDNGSSYSTINTARSALSTLILVDGRTNFGSHPLVVRFMKGIFNVRPPVARYTETWDVNIVLKFVLTLSPVKDLSTKQLTLKLCILMALISGQRSQTLHLLEVSHMKKANWGYAFTLTKVLKHSRSGGSLPTIVFRAYPQDRRLCVVTVLKEYLFRRKARVAPTEERLFVSYVAPFKGVTISTISRWVKTVLCAAGINTEVFKAHSTRAASCSKAKIQDVPMEDILKAGGWSNTRTFGKFYNKAVTSNTFAEAVLKM